MHQFARPIAATAISRARARWLSASALPYASSSAKRGLFTRQDFVYDAEKDHYTCPAGEHLTRGLVRSDRRGDPDAARAFLASWLPRYPRNGALYSHLSWHLALGHLEVGDAAAAFRLF